MADSNSRVTTICGLLHAAAETHLDHLHRSGHPLGLMVKTAAGLFRALADTHSDASMNGPFAPPLSLSHPEFVATGTRMFTKRISP